MNPYRSYPVGGPVPTPPAGFTWAELMRLALAEANAGLIQGEVPVGAVLVDGHGTLLAATANRVERDCDATAHAEIMAIRQAGATLGTCRLAGCVLVVTLEPCLMCAAACIMARLDGVVYGASDPAFGAVASNTDYFDSPASLSRIWHMGGILGQECADLLNGFFAFRRK